MKRVRDVAGSSEPETEGPRLGAPASQLRCPVGRRRAFLVHRRAAVVTMLALAAALAVVAVSVLFGAYNISGTDALHTLLTGSGSRMDRFFVLNQRLPRAVAAVLVGAMLALSGAVFQSLSRNPLGSPDIVGFTTGASSGGLFMLLLVASASDLQVSVGAVLGGFATAAVVALVSRRGGVGGDNLILTGVAISEMLSAANSYLISQARAGQAPGSGSRGAADSGGVARAACESAGDGRRRRNRPGTAGSHSARRDARLRRHAGGDLRGNGWTDRFHRPGRTAAGAPAEQIGWDDDDRLGGHGGALAGRG